MAMAIITRYMNATAKRGSRIKVQGWLKSKLYQWDEALSVEENHAMAVAHFVYELNKERSTSQSQWSIVQCGQMPDTSGYAYIIQLD